jgi:hypothetical protein
MNCGGVIVSVVLCVVMASLSFASDVAGKDPLKDAGLT